VHHGNVSMPMVRMMTVKMHLNIVVSTKGVQYCTFDLKDFYLNIPMEQPEYMWMKLSDLPRKFVDLYNLTKIEQRTMETCNIKVKKGMYGLPQAGILAHRLLDQWLNEHRYQQSQVTPGLWKHSLRPISFMLCIGNFGVKYVGREHAEHLLQVLNMHYMCSQDWDGKKYLGMDIDWDYKQRKVHVSMLKYVPKVLMRVQHKAPSMPQHQPYPHIKPTYGATRQYAEASDTSELLSKENKTYVQEVIGMFLYYARCVDSSMLPALKTLATQQATPTKNIMKKIKQFLDYALTNPNAVITYHASNMVLARDINALYLSKSNARSRARDHFFMSSNVELPPNNVAVSTILQTTKAVMSLVAEAKVGALVINCHEEVPARHVLKLLGHPQPPTPMQMDNTTALGVVNQYVMKKIKLMDLKYHWLQCRISQKQF
jgi:hypothetical protein